MKTLILITSHFPFGKGEPFIETEFPFLSASFEKIVIIAQNITDLQTRHIPGNVKVYRFNTATTLSGFFYLPVLFIINSESIIKMLWQEVEFRLSAKNRLIFRNFLFLFKRIIKATQLKTFINKKLAEERISGTTVFYSYWLKTGAHAIAMLNYPNSIKISRAHGSDLYEEKTSQGYLPLLKFSALNLDQIFFVSDQGKEYLEKKLKIPEPHFIVSHLGVDRPQNLNDEPDKSDKFLIVSCSNLIPLKRIDLIIDSLEITNTEKEILWLHFGDGILKDELEALANKQLGHLKGLTYKFMGHVPNNELLKFYNSHKVDLFLNTSVTEGVPVSIMEAQSFGIPVIATDTGGVKEIVSANTGSLLPVDFHREDLANLIKHYINLPEEEQKQVRISALNNWKLNFNASVNYNDFIMKLNSIFASSKERNILKS